MSRNEWKTVRCIVEMRVRGDFSEKDFCWAVKRNLKSSGVSNDALHNGATAIGRLEFKSAAKVAASAKVGTPKPAYVTREELDARFEQYLSKKDASYIPPSAINRDEL